MRQTGGLSFPRRQQYRRLSRAAMAGIASGATVLLALEVASAGAVSATGALLVLAVGLGLYARHWLLLADRIRIGARSEDEVRRALAPLHAERWRLRHSLPWRGRGDIDSLAIAPTGVAFAIETKCAARRPVVSPAQPGGTRREVLGSNGLPGSER
jgi:Nuclease-related domain